MVWNSLSLSLSLSRSLLLHIPIESSPHANLLCTVRLRWIDRLVLRPMRKARDGALAVRTRAVPEERIEHASEVEHGAVDMDASG
jgi:hypothetical protein